MYSYIPVSFDKNNILLSIVFCILHASSFFNIKYSHILYKQFKKSRLGALYKKYIDKNTAKWYIIIFQMGTKKLS